MEDLLELLGFVIEIIVEGSLEIGTEKKVPMPIRILTLLVFMAVFMVLAGFFYALGNSCMKDGNTGGAYVWYGIASIILIGAIGAIVKKYRDKRKDDDTD